jgi:pectin methylesterase-like acyl-CoA thioesterase
MRCRPGVVVAIASAVVLAACSSSSSGSHPTGGSAAVGTTAARVLLVGTYKGHAGRYTTIRSAVDAAKPGDWVLVAPGDYHERYDHTAPKSAAAGADATSGV